MKNWIKYLREKSDLLADLMGEERTDWDSIINTTTDEELEYMASVERFISQPQYDV